jgi:hypothetical protein
LKKQRLAKDGLQFRMKRIYPKLSNTTFQVLFIEKGDHLTLKNFMPYLLKKSIGLFGKKLQGLKDFSGWQTTLVLSS